MNLKDRARFAHIAALNVRATNGVRLGLSERISKTIAEATDDDESVISRCRISGFHVEAGIVQQESVAVAWHEGFRFYQPHKRLFLLWILHGFFRSVVRGKTDNLTDLKSIQLRSGNLGLGISQKAISSYVRDAAARKGWWELADHDQDARVRQVIPSSRMAFIAHLSHLCAFAQIFAISSVTSETAHRRDQWSEMGYPIEDLEEHAEFIRANRSVPDSHV